MLPEPIDIRRSDLRQNRYKRQLDELAQRPQHAESIFTASHPFLNVNGQHIDTIKQWRHDDSKPSRLVAGIVAKRKASPRIAIALVSFKFRPDGAAMEHQCRQSRKQPRWRRFKPYLRHPRVPCSRQLANFGELHKARPPFIWIRSTAILAKFRTHIRVGIAPSAHDPVY